MISHLRRKCKKSYALTGEGERLAERIAIHGVVVVGRNERHLDISVNQLTVRLVGDNVDGVAVLGRLFVEQLGDSLHAVC